jgi:hypothetical protein
MSPTLSCQSQCQNVTGTPVNVTGSALNKAIEEYLLSPSDSPYGSVINCWDVSQVTDMSGAFAISSFDGPLNCWDVSSVTDMGSMFHKALWFNQDIGSWDVSSVKDFSSMFDEARSFNQNIGSWNVSSARRMTFMFYLATDFNQNLCEWGEKVDVTQLDAAFMFQFSYCDNDVTPTWSSGRSWCQYCY